MPQVAPEAVAGLLDDAALFPPRSAPMEEAVPAHDGHLASWYGALVGPFVVSDRLLGELRRHSRASSGAPFRINVIVTGGPDCLPPELSEGVADGALDLAGLEILLASGEGMLASARSATRLLATLPALQGYVEVPVQEVPDAVLDVLASGPAAVKLRTGGLETSAFPSDAQVARLIVACVEREMAFKCTAGLHSAVRHREKEHGFERQGFANILLATHAAIVGAPVETVTRLLGDRDEDAVVAALTALGHDQLQRARSIFRSFGTCSVEEPVEDLLRLGLLQPPGEL